MGKSVAKGGKEGSAAMTEIAKALASIEDETKRNEIVLSFSVDDELCRSKIAV